MSTDKLYKDITLMDVLNHAGHSVKFDMPVEPVDEEAIVDETEPLPFTPDIDSTDGDLDARFVEYSVRGPNDVVVSGPITGGSGPGRWHRNRRQAFKRMCLMYGHDRVLPTKQSMNRWSFLIKDLKTKGVIKHAA